MRRFSLWFLIAGVLALVLTACGSATQDTASATPATDNLQGTLTIFHAGSLTVPVKELTQAFQQKHPSVSFATEAAGSRTVARKVSELGKQADVVMVADYTVIDNLLKPDFAQWNIRFARNAMVIAYTDHSRYADEIDSDNWYKILLRDGVVYGHSDPNADPAGYRALLVWQLAEKYYHVPGLAQQLEAHCPPSNVRPKETDLLALLDSGDMDYAFEYLSLATQHHLRYVALPEEINLSNPKFASFYAQAQVELNGTRPGETITKTGAPIIYGLTIPTNAPHPDLAAAFVQFVLSAEGQAILQKLGQPPLVPPLADHPNRLPPLLQPLVTPAN